MRLGDFSCLSVGARFSVRGIVLRHASEPSGEDQYCKTVWELLFADGGRSASAVRRSGAAANCTAQRAADGQFRVKFIFGGCGGRAKARAAEDNAASRRKCLGCATLRVASFRLFFIRYLLFGQKVTPKTAAVKRFRVRPCVCAESDAFGTFEAIKSSLTQTFSRLGKARTRSALLSAYRKRSPILNAPSLRPTFFRNRFCRGMG